MVLRVRSRPPVVTHADSALTTTTNGARTSACTSDPEPPHLQTIVALLKTLPADQKITIARMLQVE